MSLANLAKLKLLLFHISQYFHINYMQQLHIYYGLHMLNVPVLPILHNLPKLCLKMLLQNNQADQLVG